MSFKFWGRKSKKKDTANQDIFQGIDKAQGSDRCRVIMDLPAGFAGKGFLLRVNGDGRPPEIVQEEAEVLESLGTKLEIGYDPNFRGSWPWFILFEVSYTWRGNTFGQEIIDLVKECGLNFPPDRGEFKVHEDGRVFWASQVRPTAEQIVQVIQEAQRQVEAIVRSYWFNLKAELVRGRRKAK